jgi:YVTN family beta-propeller protein
VFAVVFSISANQDAFAHHVLQKIPVSGAPMDMSLTDDFLYVSSFEYPHISIIDIEKDENIGFITTSSSGIMSVEAVPEKNKIYAAPFGSGGIDVYALSTKLLIKTIPLPDSEITIQSSSNQPYGQRSDVHFITGGWSLDYNPTKELLYVADYNSHLVYVIDGKTDEIIQTIPVSRHPFTIRADPISNTVMVASLAGNEITFLDDVTDQNSVKPIHEVTKTITVTGAPWGIELDPRWHLAYVTNRGCECITVINTLEKNIVGTIPLGDKAQAITVDVVEHQIYASYLTQNKIVKIDGNTNQIGSSWDIESKPWSIKMDSNTHKFYSALKSEDSVLVLGPVSYSITLPVVTMQSPSAFVGLLYVHSQDVKASDPFVDVENTLLTMNIESQDGGKMAVNIPRNVLDSQKGSIDAPFEVLIDGKTAQHEEFTGDASGRIISVMVAKNSENITIIGTSGAHSDESLQSPTTYTIPDTKIVPENIICQDKVWVENMKGKLVCTSPETAKKLVERGWGTYLVLP